MNETPKLQTPFIPADAPFNEDQKSWLAGFLAGYRARAELDSAAAATGAGDAMAPQIHILFGTQTGNAEAAAQEAAETCQQQGFAPLVQGIDEITMEDLVTMKLVIVVISTYGEGEMPDNAVLFWEELTAMTAPRLEHMKYGVLALGDTGYDEFCQAGKLIDMRFEQLGAERLLARQDCDVDYEDLAAEWVDASIPLFKEHADATDAVVADSQSAARKKPAKSKWNRKNPYPSPTIENRRLSGPKSAKEIRHFSFSLTDSDIEYAAGDALGVVPVNDTALVDLLLDYFGADWETTIPGHDKPIGDLLKHDLEISTPPKRLVETVASRNCDEELSNIVANGDKEALEAFMWGRDTLDLLEKAGKNAFSAEDLVDFLKPLQHRAYSISSSPKAHDREVHLTVAAVRWSHEGRIHKGVCSTFLADHIAEGDAVPVFVSPNKSFRVPEDGDAPMIMVGPGTGIAPFRAFLEERRETGATGRNWLFFGDQHRAHDFIYEKEISRMSADGILGRLDLAFSRDQSEKVYVQSRMQQNGRELYAWLEEGGYFYVCGDATRMARDVDAMLHTVIMENGALPEDKAVEYVNNLKREKRYLRDVY